ncbi:MAG: 1,4-alpha-glucan branching protein GlgB [Thermodesulfobacteriota bacterium]
MTTPKTPVIYGISPITNDDIYLFKEGNHFRLYDLFGAHLGTDNGVQGTHFTIWAPNASLVSVIGDFNGWNKTTHQLKERPDSSGIWEGFIPGIKKGVTYKFHIQSKKQGKGVDKCDPFGRFAELSPKSASIVWDFDYTWRDEEWMKVRGSRSALNSPISIYELHPGSWRLKGDKENRHLTYRELAHELSTYIKETGFTHVEFMPVMEHPFYGSWGYQITGYFAPTSRYGEPEDFMYLIDHLHQQGIGVILDWVPSHFPSDEHGLAIFDGTHLYEHEDPRLGFHPEWKSHIFNYGRHEVTAFLISNALFWLDKYHIDGLRVDAVASMLYLDYAREDGEWLPNKFGGNENLEAIEFLKKFNSAVYKHYPDAQTIAEESTDWPMVSRPVHLGGLGFGKKWNMGWMHDTLKYFSKDPIFRKFNHDKLTFSLWYAFNENFLLPLSHDEVVHGKGSLIGKMPGDEWQKFANLRALYGYMYTHPGKKLLFMGAEFGQVGEWNHDTSLDWHVLKYPVHGGLKRWVSDLNYLYKNEPALFELDFVPGGFEWIDCQDWEDSTLSFLRKGLDAKDTILVVCNFTPVPRYNYIVGVPEGGKWKELLNSDAEIYNGSGMGNLGEVIAQENPSHDRPYRLSLTLPPLSVVIFKRAG